MKTKESFKQRLVGLQGNLLSFAYQLTTNREAAEDLLQDTTLKALDNEEKYVDKVNFKGWIFTIISGGTGCSKYQDLMGAYRRLAACLL